MPTLAEFVLTIGARYNRGEDRFWICFRFETLREFRSFRYEVDVDGAFDPKKREFLFKLKGVQTPSTLMASAGPANRELCYPDLHGDYTVRVGGAKEEGSFQMVISPGGNILLGEVDPGLVRVVVREEVEMTGE